MVEKQVLPLFQGKQLEDAIGLNSSFNYVITNRGFYESYDEWLADNAERIRTNLRRWLENDHFDPIEDEYIDLAIMYEYRDADRACDLDNLIKPVISALDGSSGHTPYLVEDDEQIRRIHLERRHVDPVGLQMNYTIRPRDINRGNATNEKNAHGRITISFRKHDPTKPMRIPDENNVI